MDKEVLNKKVLLNKSEALKKIIENFTIGIILNVFAWCVFGRIGEARGFLIFFSLILIISLLSNIIEEIRTIYNILNFNFFIVTDILKDKKYITNTDANDIPETKYYFYFENYFKKYNKKVEVNYSSYNNYNENDKYYLFFVKGKGNPVIFNDNAFILDDDLQNKVVIDEEIKESKEIKDNEQIVENKVEEEKIISHILINKDLIIKNFYENKGKSLVKGVTLYFLVVVIFFVIAIISNYSDGGILGILLGLLSMIIPMFIFIGIPFLLCRGKLTYIKNVISDLKNDKFYIVEDVVKKVDENILIRNTNEDISFKNSNEMISFQMEKNNVLYASRKLFFYKTQENDIFYLVFVESDKNNPIQFYNQKYVKLSDEIISKLKI